jgi:hypothetical protein
MENGKHKAGLEALAGSQGTSPAEASSPALIYFIGKWKMGTGLEALAGDVPQPPAEASSPVSIFHLFHSPFAILHLPLS